MKKAISILLAITLLSVLAACSSADDTSTQINDAENLSLLTPTPEPEAESVPIDPQKIYFFDTYNQIESNPQIMWGDLNWEGWEDTAQPLIKEADGWYSFTMPSTRITDNYNMIIFFNGLPDSDPDCIQWVWSVNDNLPKGNFFIADNKNPINPPEAFFKGTQRNATSFATKENAMNAINGASPSTPEADEFVEWRVTNSADDFYALLSEKILDYANYLTAFSDAFVGIYTDVAMGNNILDNADYLEIRHSFLEWSNGVKTYPTDKIFSEHQALFEYYDNIATLTFLFIYPLDNVTSTDQIDSLVSTFSDSVTIQLNQAMSMVTQANTPEITIGETINLDFADITVVGFELVDEILPPDTSRGYIKIVDTPGEKYFIIRMNIKNISGEELSIQYFSVKSEFTFNDTYTYTGNIIGVSDDEKGFYGSSVIPLKEKEFILYASVPDELEEIYNNAAVTFGFNYGFGGIAQNTVDYMFRLILD